MRQKVCIGIPCYSVVASETLEDYMRFAYHLGRRYQEYDFFLRIKSKSEQFRARNAIVESAITIGADWLLMLDDDHVICTDDDPGNPQTGAEAYDFLRKLMDHDVDIVGPVYYQRGGSAQPVVMDENEFGEPAFISDLDLTGGLDERAVQGGGCILIKMEVFNKIDTPWFEPEFQWGTDIQLCKKAREKGFKVYNDSSLEIGHVMSERIVVTSKNKDKFKTDGNTVGSNGTPRELNWRTESILHKYKYDAAEFLGVKESEIDETFNRLKENYGYHTLYLQQEYGLGTEEYYGHMGPEQLVRQVLFHHNDHKKAELAEILMDIKPARMIGLDFGCGSALIGFELAKRGGKIHLIDVDGATGYEFTKWRVKKYGLENVSFEWPEPGTLSYCLCMDSIEHLHNWQEILKKIIHHLRPGGNLITNFMLIEDNDNEEHVFMDKGAFMAFMVDNGMRVHADTVFVKRFAT